MVNQEERQQQHEKKKKTKNKKKKKINNNKELVEDETDEVVDQEEEKQQQQQQQRGGGGGDREGAEEVACNIARVAREETRVSSLTAPLQLVPYITSMQAREEEEQEEKLHDTSLTSKKPVAVLTLLTPGPMYPPEYVRAIP